MASETMKKMELEPENAWKAKEREAEERAKEAGKTEATRNLPEGT